ncbi:hypothetical protein SAMN05216258_107251 [Albimonas pacifica]|uniref:Uncharacterized protein n=1 Tax=Albimonas pacifica TaxID=1114924 RepID=A0A1I3IW59_9RHOB|nr:hypothetical protein SAMN05216258_107251 [Albimonas pacifica]
MTVGARMQPPGPGSGAVLDAAAGAGAGDVPRPAPPAGGIRGAERPGRAGARDPRGPDAVATGPARRTAGRSALRLRPLDCAARGGLPPCAGRLRLADAPPGEAWREIVLRGFAWRDPPLQDARLRPLSELTEEIS